jgi:hypothetical protein
LACFKEEFCINKWFVSPIVIALATVTMFGIVIFIGYTKPTIIAAIDYSAYERVKENETFTFHVNVFSDEHGVGAGNIPLRLPSSWQNQIGGMSVVWIGDDTTLPKFHNMQLCPVWRQRTGRAKVIAFISLDGYLLGHYALHNILDNAQNHNELVIEPFTTEDAFHDHSRFHNP